MPAIVDGYVLMYDGGYYGFDFDVLGVDGLIFCADWYHPVVVYESEEAAMGAIQDVEYRLTRWDGDEDDEVENSKMAHYRDILSNLDVIPFADAEEQIEDKGFVVEAEWLL